MWRVMLGLLLLAIGLALTGRGAPAATAAPQPAAVTTYRVLPEDEREHEDYVHARLQAQLPVVARNLAGWRCVRARPTPPGGEDRPPGTHVWVEAVVRRLAADEGPPGTYRVTLQIHIQGATSVRASRLVGPDDYHSFLGPAEALGNTAVFILEELAGQVSPCKTKATLKGTHKQQGANLFFERRYDGEADLALNEDGSFAATMTLPDSFVMTTSGPVQCRFSETGGTCQGDRFSCSGSFQPRPTELTLAGGYRDGDGSLVFTRMEGAIGSRSASARCCAEIAGCWETAWEIPSASGNLIPGGEVAVALADGASAAIPLPAGVPGEWQMTLTLAYGGDGTGSASTTSAAGFPLLTD